MNLIYFYVIKSKYIYIYIMSNAQVGQVYGDDRIDRPLNGTIETAIRIKKNCGSSRRVLIYSK